MKLKTYLPNRLRAGLMALAPMQNGALHPNAHRAFTPIRAVQIVGGRRWSLSIIVKEDKP